jgi:enoyl-CoA hydratase/carnithine racemase
VAARDTGDTGGAVLLSEPGPGIRLISLNRPAIRNAMTAEMTLAWDEAVARVTADEGTRVLVVTGEGSSFCSGADLSWLDQDAPEDVTIVRMRERMLPLYRSWLSVRTLPFPVLAAVNGPAVGAGACLALACDLRFAGPGAYFSTPFVYLGTHAGMGATWLLQEAVGVTRARDMLFTGREIHPPEALGWGLVTGVADDALAHTLEVAARIVEAAPIATALTKTGLQQAAGGLEAALQWEAMAQPVTMATADLQEGMAAFLENRRPRFQGH